MSFKIGHMQERDRVLHDSLQKGASYKHNEKVRYRRLSLSLFSCQTAKGKTVVPPSLI